MFFRRVKEFVVQTCDGLSCPWGGEAGVEHSIPSSSHELLKVLEPRGIELADDFPAAGGFCGINGQAGYKEGVELNPLVAEVERCIAVGALPEEGCGFFGSFGIVVVVLCFAGCCFWRVEEH